MTRTNRPIATFSLVARDADTGAPADCLETFEATDEGMAQRQFGIVSADGASVTFTGNACHAWAGGRSGRGYAAQGNNLAGTEVIDLRVDDHPDPIPELQRLLELHRVFMTKPSATPHQLHAEEIVWIQRLLRERGLLNDEPTGTWSDETERALASLFGSRTSKNAGSVVQKSTRSHGNTCASDSATPRWTAPRSMGPSRVAEAAHRCPNDRSS